MNIRKTGDISKQRRGEFSFKCKNCGCEWDANRSDKGLNISSPCVEFYTYMKCPNCGRMTYDR